MTVMFVGLLSLASSTVTGMATNETNRESARATSAARQFIETMQFGEVPFEDLFRSYTVDAVTQQTRDGEGLIGGLLDTTGDLLEGAGGLLGGGGGGSLLGGETEGETGGLLEGLTEPVTRTLCRTFEVVGLSPAKESDRTKMGEVYFPVAEGVEGLELREDVAGRDLNGDGVIDNLCHAHDYKILPVTVKVEWKGTRGVRQIEFNTILVKK